jgi:hypothetical protein
MSAFSARAPSDAQIQDHWYRQPCYAWPNCPRGGRCTYLHGADDRRPQVQLKLARDREQAEINGKQAVSAQRACDLELRRLPEFVTASEAGKTADHARAAQSPSRGCAPGRPEPPAVDTEASEALLKWLADRLLATKQVIV